MKLADEQVQRVFKQMTPAVVTEMIREEINPLDMDFEALSEVSEQMGGQLGESDAKKFGEYLWKLEQKHEIKEDERESYIGIYRLIHQVERTDGAAVGALVNQGAPITMRNLLMAVRSENRSGRMDYRVDEAFGNVEGNLVSSITEQAEAAYQTACLKDAADALTPDTLQTVLESDIDWEELTPEQLKEALESAKDDETGLDRAYAAEQLSLLEECADASEEIYEQLEHYDIPVTVSHVLAMNGLMKDRNQVFRKLFEEDGEELAEEFMDALSSKESMEKAEEHLENTAEEVVQTSLLQDGVTSLDVRELRMLSAQIDLSRYMAREEHYSVPMQTSDGIINVSLKLVRGTGQKGVVDIAMETEHGKIAASFRAGEKGISGLIATDDPDTEQLLAEQYNDPMDWEEETKLQVAYMDDLDLNRFSGVLAKTEDGTSEESAYEVQTKRLYGIAENFIRSIRDLL
jgi:hypothetical protein